MYGVLFLLFLHLWYVLAWIIQHDVHVFFEKLPYIVVEKTRLGHTEFWLLWDMNREFIPILNVISHYMVFLYQS